MIGPSIASVENNYSFGFYVNRGTTWEQIQQDPERHLHNEQGFAGCSGYTRFRTTQEKQIFFVPITWIPERFRSDEFMKKWEREMKLMGGNATYLGRSPYLGRYFVQNGSKELTGDEQVTEFMCGLRGAGYPGFEDSNLTTNEWAVWEINSYEYNNACKNYHSFCLLRYLWSRHFNRIVDYYFEIKKKLCVTKPEPIEILQLALYTFDYQTCAAPDTQRYHSTYSHINFSARTFAWPILKWKELEERFNLNSSDEASLQVVFGRSNDVLRNVTYPEVLELINNKKYKAAYELLRKK